VHNASNALQLPIVSEKEATESRLFNHQSLARREQNTYKEAISLEQELRKGNASRILFYPQQRLKPNKQFYSSYMGVHPMVLLDPVTELASVYLWDKTIGKKVINRKDS